MRSKLSSQGIAHRRRPLRDTKRAEDPPSSRKSLREQKSYRGFWAYDTPIPGWRGTHVNALRLWSARAPDPLQLDRFHSGDHVGALMDRVRAELISKVLYPSDATPAGQELRLRQEYFFASASLQDSVRRHLSQHDAIELLADKVAIQLNDTHPAIAVAELMRIFVDLHQVPWRDAWAMTQATFGYTNHTLLPEALETWPVPLMERLLPRHMQIIYLINAIRSRPDEQASRRDRRETLGAIADRRSAWAPGSHGPSRVFGLAQSEWGVETPFRLDEGHGVPRS